MSLPRTSIRRRPPGALSRTAVAVMPLPVLVAIAFALLLAGQREPVSAAAPRALVPPAAVTATLIGKAAVGPKPGAVLHSSSLGQRVFPIAKVGFALARVGGADAATYPAVSVDGGSVWRVDGPPLYVAAADAPALVLKAGAAGAKTYFAWGGPGSGGQVVDVTRDAGKHWYGAALGAELEAVVSGPKGELVAFAQAESDAGSAAATWVYVSTDGGRHWHYRSSL